MMNPNDPGIIYYGTDFKFLPELDQYGLGKPRYRNEQYISVSVSGYRGIVRCEHPELVEMARVFTEELKIASLEDGYLHYHPGYENTITYQHGFGPNPNEWRHSYFGLVKNERTQDTITLVISKDVQKDLVFPDQCREFEYLSLALHGFLAKIDPGSIVGWIAPESRVKEVQEMMERKILKQRLIWADTEFTNCRYDLTRKQRYGYFPWDIRMYLQDLAKDGCYKAVRTGHLQRILGDVVHIDWESNVEGELTAWLGENEEKIRWNPERCCYECMKESI